MASSKKPIKTHFFIFIKIPFRRTHYISFFSFSDRQPNSPSTTCGGLRRSLPSLPSRSEMGNQIKFCCLQSETAEPYLSLCGLNRDDVLRRFLFVEGPGVFHQGSNAALRVVSYLPFPYSALSGFRVFPTPIRDSVYDYVAKRRYEWFGKENDCLVLGEKEMLERFIDRDEILGKRKT